MEEVVRLKDGEWDYEWKYVDREEIVKRLLDEFGSVIEDLERKVDSKMKQKIEIEMEKKALKIEIERWEKKVVKHMDSYANFIIGLLVSSIN